MSETTPITQRHVADACGVHPSTICLALKNSPSIPLATRRRIQAVADQLGYHPNVAARNLALLRTEKKSAGTLPVAWINQEPRREHWRTHPEAREFFENARHQAESHGYHLEEIWAKQPGMTIQRVLQIVRARGIEGVVLPVHQHFDPASLDAGWNDFATVGLNDLRLSGRVDTVAADFYQNTELAVRRVRQLGARRIGLALTVDFDAASNGLAHGCFLRHQAEAPRAERVPVCFLPARAEERAAALAGWLDAHAPEAVLCTDNTLEAEVAHAPAFWLQLQQIGEGSERPSTSAPARSQRSRWTAWWARCGISTRGAGPRAACT